MTRNTKLASLDQLLEPNDHVRGLADLLDSRADALQRKTLARRFPPDLLVAAQHHRIQARKMPALVELVPTPSLIFIATLYRTLSFRGGARAAGLSTGRMIEAANAGDIQADLRPELVAYVKGGRPSLLSPRLTMDRLLVRLLRNMLVLAVEQRTTGEPSPISRRLVYGIEDSLSPGRLTRLVARPRSTVRASINQISAAALVAPCRRSLRQALRIPLTASVGTLRLDQLQQLAFALGRKGQCPARAVYMQAYREG